jgi:hypothetical protein
MYFFKQRTQVDACLAQHNGDAIKQPLAPGNSVSSRAPAGGGARGENIVLFGLFSTNYYKCTCAPHLPSFL